MTFPSSSAVLCIYVPPVVVGAVSNICRDYHNKQTGVQVSLMIVSTNKWREFEDVLAPFLNELFWSNLGSQSTTTAAGLETCG